MTEYDLALRREVCDDESELSGMYIPPDSADRSLSKTKRGDEAKSCSVDDTSRSVSAAIKTVSETAEMKDHSLFEAEGLCQDLLLAVVNGQVRTVVRSVWRIALTGARSGTFERKR